MLGSQRVQWRGWWEPFPKPVAGECENAMTGTVEGQGF